MTSYGKLSSAYNELYIQENYGIATQTYPWNWGDGWSLDPARERCKKDNYGRDCRTIGAIIYPSCKGGSIDNSKNFFPYRDQGLIGCAPNLCLQEIPGENWKADPTNKNQQTKNFKEISRGSSANCNYVYPEDSDNRFTTLSYTTTGDKNIKVTRKCNTAINCEGVYSDDLNTKDYVNYYKNRTEIKVPACGGGLASTCPDTINVFTLQNTKPDSRCQYPGMEYKASYGKLSNGLDCKCDRGGFWRCTQPKK